MFIYFLQFTFSPYLHTTKIQHTNKEKCQVSHCARKVVFLHILIWLVFYFEQALQKSTPGLFLLASCSACNAVMKLFFPKAIHERVKGYLIDFRGMILLQEQLDSIFISKKSKKTPVKCYSIATLNLQIPQGQAICTSNLSLVKETLANK